MIICPKCGKSYYQVLYSINDCVYRPTIIKDGKIINNKDEGTSTTCQCLECGEQFVIKGNVFEDVQTYA